MDKEEFLKMHREAGKITGELWKKLHDEGLSEISISLISQGLLLNGIINSHDPNGAIDAVIKHLLEQLPIMMKVKNDG